MANKKKKRKASKQNTVTFIAALLVVVSFLAAVKFLSQMVTEHYDEQKTVCLDAGHGGSDSGALSSDRKRKEKDDNLKLTLKVRDELERMGVQVVLTRDDDSTVSLKQRCRTANRKHCDLFIALHRNSSAKGTGFEAWIAKNEKNGERKIAKQLVASLSEISGLENRGVHSGYRDRSANNYYINANTEMPSILLEVGFITNEKDNKEFDEKLDNYANAIAKIIYDSL